MKTPAVSLFPLESEVVAHRMVHNIDVFSEGLKSIVYKKFFDIGSTFTCASEIVEMFGNTH